MREGGGRLHELMRCLGSATDWLQEPWGCQSDGYGHIARSSGPHGCYHSGSHKNGSAKRHAEQATAATTAAQCWQSSGTARHPGHCVQLCIIHAWARRVLSPRCHRNIRAVRRALRVQRCANCITQPFAQRPRIPIRCISCLAADQSRLRGWRIVCCLMGGRLSNLTYSSSAGLGRGFTAGGLSLPPPTGKPQRCHARQTWRRSTQLRCVFATAP